MHDAAVKTTGLVKLSCCSRNASVEVPLHALCARSWGWWVGRGCIFWCLWVRGPLPSKLAVLPGVGGGGVAGQDLHTGWVLSGLVWLGQPKLGLVQHPSQHNFSCNYTKKKPQPQAITLLLWPHGKITSSDTHSLHRWHFSRGVSACALSTLEKALSGWILPQNSAEVTRFGKTLDSLVIQINTNTESFSLTSIWDQQSKNLSNMFPVEWSSLDLTRRSDGLWLGCVPFQVFFRN